MIDPSITSIITLSPTTGGLHFRMRGTYLRLVPSTVVRTVAGVHGPHREPAPPNFSLDLPKLVEMYLCHHSNTTTST